ncbi:DUF1877 family protein [Nocardia takedensis]|uniref:DUF1877 family protein n=1 Tax=Nocardia takedensis TaxID=259390 RepID=UPI0012F69C6E|nr:DUF1877 family protein [Nocardia takedensis]
MSFTAVSEREADGLVRDAKGVDSFIGLERAGYGHVYLDKAWGGIRYLMAVADLGVDLLETPAFLGDEGNQAIWDAELVARTSATLWEVPFADLLPYFDQARMARENVYPNIWGTDWARDYILDRYRDLRQFFFTTAAREQAALMNWG